MRRFVLRWLAVPLRLVVQRIQGLRHWLEARHVAVLLEALHRVLVLREACGHPAQRRRRPRLEEAGPHRAPHPMAVLLRNARMSSRQLALKGCETLGY